MKHGEGVIISSNGKILRAQFEDDKLTWLEGNAPNKDIGSPQLLFYFDVEATFKCTPFNEEEKELVRALYYSLR
jgi:hypothetical protein